MNLHSTVGKLSCIRNELKTGSILCHGTGKYGIVLLQKLSITVVMPCFPSARSAADFANLKEKISINSFKK